MARITKAQQAARDEAVTFLRQYIKPGATVYTNLRRVSRSGMRRLISVHVVRADEGDRGLWDITGHVAAAMGHAWDRDAFALKVDGCGMDMGFHVVDSLAWTLYPEHQKRGEIVLYHKWV